MPSSATATDAPAPVKGTGLQAVCLAGPTASGKSALAMALARRFAVEIISVDSALVYRGMDIGTAKPSAADRAAVPHHLIDIIDPLQSYSAARFATDARRLVAEIRARQRLPLLVGGTMLYFKALRDGISTMPAADAGVRARIDQAAAAHGWPALHAQLALVDPTTAARLAPRDAQRIQRALEVWHSSGRTMTEWHAEDTTRASDAAEADAQWPMLSLEPQSRAWLHRRIEQRLHDMVGAGFEAEVHALHQRGDLHAGLPSMRCVGYRQAWQALERGREVGLDDAAPRGGPRSSPDWLDAALVATRQLAKRQLTWLRSMPTRTVIACEAPDPLQPALHWLEAQLTQAR
jgi:tRNA dimethylallyltransferase